MAIPTRMPLRIQINFTDVVCDIPFESINIELGRRDRVSTASFTVEDIGSLSFTIEKWQWVSIGEPNGSIAFFIGYVTDITKRKRENSLQIDADIECSSVETRLIKSVCRGVFTGTDADILADILANTAPDLSGLFDFSTDVTSILTTDTELVSDDLSALEALERLAQKTGAEYFFDPTNAERTNLMYNPALTNNMDHYGSDLSANGFFSLPTWNPANTTWGAGYGESGGGIQTVSQLITGAYRQAWRVGRDQDSDPHIFEYTRDDEGNGLYLQLSFRAKVTASGGGPTRAVNMELITYSANGSLYANDNVVIDVFSVGGWQDVWGAWDLSDNTIFDESGYFEWQCWVTSVNSSTITLDSHLVEIVASSPASAGSYFDGESANAQWTGTANNSASVIIESPLNWSDTPPDAPFDVDIGVGDDIFGNLEVLSPAIDSINSVIVTGGFEYEDIDWIYFGNGQQVHWDTETQIFPLDGEDFPRIYRNTGSEGSPSWTQQTVADRTETLGVGNDVLWDAEDHWIEWNSAPPNFYDSWRVVGRIKLRIRVTVTDSDAVSADGVELYDAIYDDKITSQDDAFYAGQAELDSRAAPLSVKFDTYEPGLIPGQKIDVTDSGDLNLAETDLIIERVNITSKGGGYAFFRVECGAHIPTFIDVAAQTYRMAEKRAPIDASTESVTLVPLQDENGVYLQDENGLQLYAESSA